MMNETEFMHRGKRLDTGVIVFGYYVVFDSHSEGKDPYLHIIISKDGQYNRVIPETVGRCTGMVDVNGKEIFEGDIIQCNDNPKDLVKAVFGEFAVIEMDSEISIDRVIGWHYDVIPNSDPLSKLEPFCLSMPITEFYIDRCKMKVIGNIHDNPELLGDTAQDGG